MKKLMSFVCAALFAFSFCAVMPSNAFSADPNRQEVEKRFELNSATAEELANADYVTYTFNSDGTMSWTDEDGQVSSQLAPEEQELFQFPMVWTKQAA